MIWDNSAQGRATSSHVDGPAGAHTLLLLQTLLQPNAVGICNFLASGTQNPQKGPVQCLGSGLLGSAILQKFGAEHARF